MRRVLLAGVGAAAGTGELAAAARVLRDAGHEAVLAGSGQTAEHVLAAAVAEDVDAIGIAGAGAGEAVERVRELCRGEAPEVAVFALGGDAADVLRHVGAG